MKKEQTYSVRELNHYFKDIREDITEIKRQTTAHNGRLTRTERILLIFGTALAVLLITNGSELIKIFKLII